MAYFVLGLIGVGGLAVVGFFAFRLVKEIRPTIEQAKSIASILRSTIQESTEIGQHFKSITEKIQREKEEIQITAAEGRQALGNISNLVMVAKPMGDTFKLLKRTVEPQTVPVKAKNLLEEIEHTSLATWQKTKAFFVKRFSKPNRKARTIALTGIPLVAGTAVGSYAIYWMQMRRRKQYEAEMPQEEFTERWDQLRSVPSSEAEVDDKKKR